MKGFLTLIGKQLQPQNVEELNFIWSDYLNGKFHEYFSLPTFQLT